MTGERGYIAEQVRSLATGEHRMVFVAVQVSAVAVAGGATKSRPGFRPGPGTEAAAANAERHWIQIWPQNTT
ncbi:hypothetical protein [Actinomadura nitritigenes]|uniref:hypothetical protein n=1 Tax=Actinomadura nitritigenes TaxID=134602 RepID=UPI003D92AABD